MLDQVPIARFRWLNGDDDAVRVFQRQPSVQRTADDKRAASDKASTAGRVPKILVRASCGALQSRHYSHPRPVNVVFIVRTETEQQQASTKVDGTAQLSGQRHTTPPRSLASQEKEGAMQFDYQMSITVVPRALVQSLISASVISSPSGVDPVFCDTTHHHLSALPVAAHGSHVQAGHDTAARRRRNCSARTST